MGGGDDEVHEACIGEMDAEEVEMIDSIEEPEIQEQMDSGDCENEEESKNQEACIDDMGVEEVEMIDAIEEQAAATNLFMLMHIKSDRQDLSFVEKVVLAKDQISALLMKLDPRISAAKPINDGLVSKVPLKTVGFYGSKKMMIQILITHKICSEEDVQRLKNDALPSGLYACILASNNIGIFYWHEGKELRNAKRNDVSCNFIRYITELCDLIYPCIEVKHDIIPKAVRSLPRKDRTCRLQLSVVKASEDDVEIRSGFTISLPKFGPDVCGFKLSEGGHRSALLFCEKCRPRVIPKTEIRHVSKDELSRLVLQWSGCSIDLHGLSERDFETFVESSGLSGAAELKNDLDQLKQEEVLQTNQLQNVEDFVLVQEEKLLKVLAKGLNAYLRIHYPWEEAVYAGTGEASKQLESFADFTKYSDYSAQQSQLADEASLENLEKDLAEIWSGGSDFENQKMLFVGDEVTFEHGAACDRQTFSAILRSSGGRTSGPVLYEEDVCTETDKISFSNNKKSGKKPVLLGDRFKISRAVELFKFVKYMSSKYHNAEVKKRSNPAACRLRSWLDCFSRDMVPPLEKKAILSEYIFANKVLFEIEGLNEEELVKRIFADSFPSTLSNDCQEKWDKLLKEDGHLNPSSPVSDAVVRACAERYRDGRCRFFAYFRKLVEDFLRPLLQHTQIATLKRRSNEVKERIRKERLSLMKNFKTILSQRGSSPPVQLQQCFPDIYYTSDMLTVKFTRHEAKGESLEWKLLEMLPTKVQLDAHASSKEHLITPIYSRPYLLITLDQTEQNLLEVIVLKSGQVLVIIENLGLKNLTLYVCPNLGITVHEQRHHVLTLKQGLDLVTFDEGTKFFACFDKGISIIKVLRFDESLHQLQGTGITLELNEYCIDGSISWMHFVPGKAELLVADQKVIRVFDVAHSRMMRPRTIELPPNLLQVCLPGNGACLTIICKCQDAQPHIATSGTGGDIEEEIGAPITVNPVEGENKHALWMHVYMLDDNMQRVKSRQLCFKVENVYMVQAKSVIYGTQLHLLLHDGGKPDVVSSVILKVTSSSEVCHVKVQNNPMKKPLADEGDEKACTELDYLYHLFDKYAINPPLGRNRQVRHITFNIMLEVLQARIPNVSDYINYARDSLTRLSIEKGKEFPVPVKFQAKIIEGPCYLEKDEMQDLLLADWLSLLLCLVPIQIARAENNGLSPLVDGLQMSSKLHYADAISLAMVIRFGLYDNVIQSWKGHLKVISSMGKQSSGKSYLLNHLTGSLLDVAGGRCTDGVWMTVRIVGNCMFIILDFEGLGSFERSGQEDVLLSILNAAISNITIFNKKDFHLDKETESVFERFQSGVTLVKQDAKLFKGLFYMAIKDVDAADVDDLKNEFLAKILQICNKSHDNFLTKMYGGNVEIAALPPFHRAEFQDSIAQLAHTVEELPPVYTNGRRFLTDLKLIMSQISAKDWSPTDSKRMAFQLSLLRTHLQSVISFACLNDDKKPLTNFNNEEDIPEMPIAFGNHVFEMRDTGLQLAAYSNSGGVLGPLTTLFEQLVPRKGMGGGTDEKWHAELECFLASIAERREHRVLEWLRINTADMPTDGDVEKLRLETVSMIMGMKQQLLLCSCKCDRCFLRCILEKSHNCSHSCNGSHRCSESCSYCREELKDKPLGDVNDCSDKAGHDGPHDCQMRSHTCAKDCDLLEKSSNCNRHCVKKSGHKGAHRCNCRQHMCKDKCSLSSCRNVCTYPIDLEHSIHACHEKFCPLQCTMASCNRTCASGDHFHSMHEKRNHQCGKEHLCGQKCEAKGNCEVLTELVKQTSTFMGKRSTFEYEHVSEQNGIRKGCCLHIPPFMTKHEGPHLHSTNPNVVHFCETRCSGCDYFCHHPVDHAGLHDTTHGNMKGKTFVSECMEIDILDRKYAWGESGEAEMCMMHCKSAGRGHVHLIACEQSEGGTCARIRLPQGARHETRKYGPEFDIPKDELTHDAYWKNMYFRDPCSADEQKEFELCAHQCASNEHNPTYLTGSSAQKSYCVEKLWHNPVSRNASMAGTGFVTEDGHHFSCNHSKNTANHVIFIIDKSGSMGDWDIKPTMVHFINGHNNRLGCVFEAMVRFIRTRNIENLHDSMSVVLFNTSGYIAHECQPMKEELVYELLNYDADGGTTYTSGIQPAEEILRRASLAVDSKPPVVIFLSDGGNNGGGDPLYSVRRMVAFEPKLVFHTIMFGNDPYKQVLEDMATCGNGTFQISLDEVQLAKSFEGLARSINPNVASLM